MALTAFSLLSGLTCVLVPLVCVVGFGMSSNNVSLCCWFSMCSDRISLCCHVLHEFGHCKSMLLGLACLDNISLCGHVWHEVGER